MNLRVLFFTSSYFPLFVIFGLRFPASQVLWWSTAGFSALCFGAALTWLTVLPRKRAYYVGIVSSITSSSADVAVYVATFILPFVTVNEPTVRDIAGFGLLLLVLGVLYVRNSTLGANPLLSIFTSYQLIACQLANGVSVILVTRGAPNTGDRIRFQMISRNMVKVASIYRHSEGHWGGAESD